MHVADIQLLVDYSYAATSRLLEAAGRLSVDDFTRPAPIAGVPSVRDILVHMLDVEQSWREALMTGGHGSAPDLECSAFPDVATLIRAWRADEDTMRSWFQTIDDTELNAPAFTGKPLWLHLMHVLNHDAQHRSEAAMLLTHWGQSPGDLDLPVYLRGWDDD